MTSRKGSNIARGGRTAAEDSARPSSDSLLSAVMRGIAGAVSEPIRGMDRSGVPGLVGGLLSGAAGVVAHPTAEILQICEQISNSVRTMVTGSQAQLRRMRLPRPVSPAEPLHPYSWLDAVGNTLMPAIQTSESEVLLMCVELVPPETQRPVPGPAGASDVPGSAAKPEAEGGRPPEDTAVGPRGPGGPIGHRFVVLTDSHLAAIHLGSIADVSSEAVRVLFKLERRDVLLVSRKGASLQLSWLGSPSVDDYAGLRSRGQMAATEDAPVGPAGSPPSFNAPVSEEQLLCKEETAAAQLEMELLKPLSYAQPNALSGCVMKQLPSDSLAATAET